MEIAIVRRTRSCITLLENISSDRSSMSNNLAALQQHGEELAAAAQRRALELEEVERRCMEQAEDIQRTVGKLGCQEEELKKQRLSIEASLKLQLGILAEGQKTLSNAENSLRAAEKARKQAEEEESERRKTGAIVGAVVVGIFTLVIGAPFGAVIGLGVGELINQLKEDEETARREVESCRSRCRDANSDIDSMESKVSSIREQTSRLADQIKELKEKRLQYHKEAGNAKEAVAFLRQSCVFWKEFKQLSEHGVDRTSLVRRIILRIKEKVSFKMRANKRVAVTFQEAWKSIIDKLDKGQEFLNPIEYH